MRLLTLDIETKPLTVHSWGLWDQRIGINQIIDGGGLPSWAAKFHGERKSAFRQRDGGRRAGMIGVCTRCWTKPTRVLGWNSDKFDVRWLNAIFAKHGMARHAVQ